RANVPKFGNWENGGNDVPYTVYFDKARKSKIGGKMINPNDPLENPEMFANLEPSTLAAPQPKSRNRQEQQVGRGAVRPTPDQRDGGADFRPQFNNSSSARNEPSYGGRGQKPARSSRASVGSEQSFERSPLHPHYQAKVMGQGSGSPSWEGRSHDSSHGTPARSRLRPVRADETSPERGAAVPRFGEWNENDPQAAENFTHIFNKVREEKNTGVGNHNASATPKHTPYASRYKPSNEPKLQKARFCEAENYLTLVNNKGEMCL
ncbi:hypothetical protein C2S52_009894, partial [Perilla frutescens var. hirtella]